MKGSRGNERPHAGRGKSPARKLQMVRITESIVRAASLTDLTRIVQTLFEHEGGKAYPWQETPDEIIEAMRSYLASGQSDREALARVPNVCSLRLRLEELYPPLMS